MKKSKNIVEIERLTRGLDNPELWKKILIELGRPSANHGRRDRHNKTIHGDKEIADTENSTIFDLTPSKYKSPEEKLEEKETISQLSKALNQMKTKDVFVLREIYLLSKTQKEVASEMGVSQTAVRKRKLRALKSAKKFMLGRNFNPFDEKNF